VEICPGKTHEYGFPARRPGETHPQYYGGGLSDKLCENKKIII